MKRKPMARLAASTARDLPGEPGFTLIEVLVALLIISISAMAILPLLLNTMDQNQAVHLKSKAKEVATQKIEELNSLPEAAIEKYLGTNTTYTSSVEYLTEDGTLTSDSSALFRRVFNISQVPGVTVYPKPVIITCVVQFPYRGQLRSCSFSTMGSF